MPRAQDGKRVLETLALRKIIGLEREKGYTDAAVIGGMDRLLKTWGFAATGAITDKILLRRFRRLHLDELGYGAMT
ncbi:hypothetical protein ACFLYV_04800, partial [Chloroflexota bacterium]